MNCWNSRHKPIEHLEHKIAVCDLETKQQKNNARSTSLFQPATTNPMKQSMASRCFGWIFWLVNVHHQHPSTLNTIQLPLVSPTYQWNIHHLQNMITSWWLNQPL